jgi:hypothetical protein
MPEWLMPLLALLGGFSGAWIGMSSKLTRLEVEVRALTAWRERAHKQLHDHNDDLLIHDIELQTALTRLEIPRAVRQRLRPDG